MSVNFVDAEFMGPSTYGIKLGMKIKNVAVNSD